MSEESKKIRLYVMNVSSLNDDETFDKARHFVSEDRRSNADRYRFRKDKNLCIGAGLLMRRAFADKTEVFENIKTNKHGKPYIEGEDIFFNISHSGEYVILAVAECEVGCDIEELAKANCDIAKKHFSEAEYETIFNAPDNQRDELFYDYWTKKESYLKAIGEGLSKDGGLSIETDKISEEGYSFIKVSLPELQGSYAMNICVKADALSSQDIITEVVDAKKCVSDI